MAEPRMKSGGVPAANMALRRVVSFSTKLILMSGLSFSNSVMYALVNSLLAYITVSVTILLPPLVVLGLPLVLQASSSAPAPTTEPAAMAELLRKRRRLIDF